MLIRPVVEFVSLRNISRNVHMYPLWTVDKLILERVNDFGLAGNCGRS